MKAGLIAFVALLWSAAASAQQPAQPQPQEPVLQPPTGGGLPVVAVPPLPTPKITATPIGQTHAIGLLVAEVIAADLASTGLVVTRGPKDLRTYSYPEVTAPVFSQWRSVGAKALVTGFVQLRDDGRLTIGCYLYDIADRREVARKGFVVPVTDWRRAAHRCADAAYMQLSGKPGLFDTSIAYVAEAAGPAGLQKRVAIMDSDGSNHRFLTSGTNSVLSPAISPAGDMVAYTAYVGRVPQVRIIELETGTDRLLLPPGSMSFAPAFSPDGSKLLFSMAANGNTDLYLVDVSGGAPQRLTSAPGIDTSASFSPDGRQITFESDRSGSSQIYVMNADGSDQRRISFGPGRYSAPAWSPIGDQIAFVRGSGIGVMASTGADERMLTAGPGDDSPVFAPNGQHILFYRAGPVGGPSSLLRVPAAGGNVRSFVTPQGASDADWSRVQE